MALKTAAARVKALFDDPRPRSDHRPRSASTVAGSRFHSRMFPLASSGGLARWAMVLRGRADRAPCLVICVVGEVAPDASRNANGQPVLATVEDLHPNNCGWEWSASGRRPMKAANQQLFGQPARFREARRRPWLTGLHRHAGELAGHQRMIDTPGPVIVVASPSCCFPDEPSGRKVHDTQPNDITGTMDDGKALVMGQSDNLLPGGENRFACGFRLES